MGREEEQNELIFKPSLSSADKSMLKLNQIKNLTTKPKENSSQSWQSKRDFGHHPNLACRFLVHISAEMTESKSDLG